MNKKPAFVIFGNSSAEAIFNIVASVSIVSDQYDVIYKNSFASNNLPFVIDDSLAKQMSIGWIQCISERRLDLSNISNTTDLLTYPDLNCSVLWPFHVADPLNFACGIPGGAMPYGDRAIIRLSETTDMNANQLIAAYEADLAAVDHDTIWAAEIQRWKHMDSLCQVQMTDFLTSHLSLRKLFLTPDHPTSLLLLELLRQILSLNRALSSAQVAAIAKRAVDSLSMEPFRAGETPVFRSVAERYSLKWWGESDRYASFDQIITREEYIYNYYITRRAQMLPNSAQEPKQRVRSIITLMRDKIMRLFHMVADRADQ